MFRKAAVIALTISLFSTVCPASRAGQDKAVVIVTPARQAIVQLAYDVYRLRGEGEVSLVSFDDAKRGTTPDVFLWEPASRRWSKISFSSYAAGSLFSAPPDLVVLMGVDNAMTAAMEKGSAWATNFKKIPLTTKADMINALDADFDFTTSEWRTLAAWHGLTLEDQNQERRRYGKWGKSGNAMPTPATESKTGNATPESIPDVPVVITETPAPAAAPAAVAEPVAPVVEPEPEVVPVIEAPAPDTK